MILTLTLITIPILFIIFFSFTKKRKISDLPNRVIIITGCDSGLGFSFAKFTHKLGFIVIATFLSFDSEGAKKLLEECDNLIGVEVNIKRKDDIRKLVVVTEKYLEDNKKAVFHALINNAGVMVFGEFDWLTNSLIEEQIDINFKGTVNLTHAVLPIILKHKGRIITLTSHCAQSTLPALSVYGATKAAQSAWCDGLRLELTKYGVKVIKFIPGSFIFHTNIMSRVKNDSQQIFNNLSNEKKSFYGTYIDRFYEYLLTIPTPSQVAQIADENLYKLIEDALISKHPSDLYKNESLIYKLHHILFQIAPTTTIRDYLITRFVKLPKWSPTFKTK